MGLIKSKPAATTSHKEEAEKETATQTATDAQLAKIAAEEAEYEAEDQAAQAEKEAAEKAASEKAEKEEKAKAAALAKAKADAKAKEEADAAAQAKAEADAKAKSDAEAKAKAEADAKAEESSETESTTETNENTEMNDKQENVVADQEVIEGELVKEEAAQKTEVAERKSTEVAKPTKSNNQVVAAAEDEGFGGIELGFGSFPVVKLVNEGCFNDSDENDLGKKFIATLGQSSEVFLYKQEGRDDGDVGYSYDGVNLSAYNGDEDFKLVSELKQAWEEEGYDLEVKKYLEVVVTLEDDQAELLGVEEVEEGLQDLEGEPVVLSLPPSAVKAFSGKVATLSMAGKAIKGAKMQFEVGKKRKNGNNTYFPWKFKLVK